MTQFCRLVYIISIPESFETYKSTLWAERRMLCSARENVYAIISLKGITDVAAHMILICG
jgi:hypothetical protein